MSFILTILLDGVAFGMVLFIISVGLTVTMGLMRVVNLAHGAFAMVGGYLTAELTSNGVFGVQLSFLPAALMGAVAAGILGGLAEMTVYRPLYLWLVIDRSLFGARLRAAVDNPSMARVVGIDVNRLFTITFVCGCGLAGFGGAIGVGMLPLEASYPLRYLVLFLIVVIVGGEGSFKGSFVAAISLGIIETAGKFLVPTYATFILYGVVFVMLLLRPNGLLPPKSAA